VHVVLIQIDGTKDVESPHPFLLQYGSLLLLAVFVSLDLMGQQNMKIYRLPRPDSIPDIVVQFEVNRQLTVTSSPPC
jgi:hypothetical protein